MGWNHQPGWNHQLENVSQQNDQMPKIHPEEMSVLQQSPKSRTWTSKLVDQI